VRKGAASKRHEELSRSCGQPNPDPSFLRPESQPPLLIEGDARHRKVPPKRNELRKWRLQGPEGQSEHRQPNRAHPTLIIIKARREGYWALDF
jgi:hypothetical protein